MRRTDRPTPHLFRLALATKLLLLLLMVAPSAAAAQDKGGAGKDAKKAGLVVNEPGSFQGYTLLAPMHSTKTYLLDMQGRVVKTWESDCTPGQSAMLLENGHLLRSGKLSPKEQKFNSAGDGGRVQEFTWDGEIIWDFKLHNDKQLPHHDLTRLPNGNILLIVWEKKSKDEMVKAGRKPASVGNNMLVDSIFEIQPNGKTSGNIVWEWHVWDHLIQDHDDTKANFGKVAEHPELIDMNFGEGLFGGGFGPGGKGPKKDDPKKDDLDKLKGIGYVGGKAGIMIPDWTHCNAVAYNAKLDQIIISSRSFSEFWIIDHSTTTAEAASHKGGKSGKGGDLLYRWGNPHAYRAGTAADQKLFTQHSAHWIAEGLPGAGHVLVFNNGGRGRNYSSVDEIELPVDAKGNYLLKPGSAFGPEKPFWSYTAPKKSDFYSTFMSGVERLANGNTVITEGPNGMLVEVTPKNEVVWKYVLPGSKGGFGPPGGGFGPPGGGFGGPPQAGQVLPVFIQDQLELTADQKKQLGEFQKEVDSKLDTLLTADQKKQFKEPKGFGGGFGGPPQPGKIMPLTMQAKLKLSDDQKKQVAELQKATDAALARLLTEPQTKHFKEIQQAMERGGPGGGGGFGPGGNAVFRTYRYGVNYPGFVGHTLTPGTTIEEALKSPKGK